MSDASVYAAKIFEFYQRLEKQFENITHQKAVPKRLTTLISFPDYFNIFDTLVNNQSLKNYIIPFLKIGIPVRIAKELGFCSRTLNIILEPENNDFCLILETKRKTASGIKDPKTPVYKGIQKVVKPAWRIDTPIPIKFANAVLYGQKTVGKRKKTTIDLAIEESILPAKLALKYAEYEHGFHLTSVGAVIDKKGKQHIGAELSDQKISFYSRWANQTNLYLFLHDPDIKKTLTFEERDILALQLLFTVSLMHSQNVIHQDLKDQNILVFRRGESFFLELTDFGIAVDEKSSHSYIATASSQFESPEIYALHYFFKENPRYCYAYYSDPKNNSMGRYMFLKNKEAYLDRIQKQQKCFAHPHKANDIWALGVVLNTLYKDTYPTLEGKKKFKSHISKLLEADRKKRISAQEAFLQQYQEMMLKVPCQNLFERMMLAALNRKATEEPCRKAKRETTTPLDVCNEYAPSFKKVKIESPDLLSNSPVTHLDPDPNNTEQYLVPSY